MSNNRWDVLVVGAGPAGALAAKAAAEAGVNVLLVDAKRRLGALTHCAEYVPRLLAAEVDFPPRSVVQTVEAMETRTPDQTVISPAPGCILDRGVFDHGLSEAAARAGVEIRAATRLVYVCGADYILKDFRGEYTVQPVAVVAADGAGSYLRRKNFPGNRPLLAGLQVEVPLVTPIDRTIVVFNRAWRYGYAWLFPKGHVANLGVGLRLDSSFSDRTPLDGAIDYFFQAGLIRPGFLARSAGAIAVGGPEPEMACSHTVLAGDAAGLTHPITGAGIPQAVFSGRLAGEAAAKYVQTGRASVWTEYQREVLGRYGRTLLWALKKRHRMEEIWDTDDFNKVVRETWPAFHEYRN